MSPPIDPSYSLVFSGNALSYISLPVDKNIYLEIGRGDFTIEWQQYQTDANSTPSIFQVGTYPYINIGISVGPDGEFFWDYNGINGIITNLYDFNDKWIYFAISRTGTNLSFFINNTQVVSVPNNYGFSDFSSNFLTIGNENDPIDDFAFGGRIYGFTWTVGVGRYSITNPPTIIPKPTYASPSDSRNRLILSGGSFLGTLGTYISNIRVLTNGTAPDYSYVTIPIITGALTASNIHLGESLANSTLTLVGGSTSIPGNFYFTSPDTIPNSDYGYGIYTYTAYFAPVDFINYTSVYDISVNIEVVRPTLPIIRTKPTASPIIQYHRLVTGNDNESGSAINGGSVIDINGYPVSGSFFFTNPTQYMDVLGSQTVSVYFVPDSPYYYNVSGILIKIEVVEPTPKSMYFDSDIESSLYIYDQALNIDTNDFTIEWHQYITENGSQYIYAFSYLDLTSYIDISTNTFYFKTPQSSTSISSAQYTFLNVWNHIAISRKGGKIYIFINGKLVISFNNTENIYNEYSYFYIGREFNGYIYGFVYNNQIGLYDASNVPVYPKTSLPAFNDPSYALILTGEVFGGVVARNNDIINNNVVFTEDQLPYYGIYNDITLWVAQHNKGLNTMVIIAPLISVINGHDKIQTYTGHMQRLIVDPKIPLAVIKHA